jgi:hypothetical protein
MWGEVMKGIRRFEQTSKISVLTLIAVLLCNFQWGFCKQKQSIDYIQVKKGKLGWGGIYLDAKRSDIEKILGLSLDPKYDENTLRCGDYHSTIKLHGRQVTIQWSDKGLQGKVESIWIDLSKEEKTTNVRKLVSQILKNVPKLIEPEVDPLYYGAYLEVKSNPGHAMLIKTIEENFLDISLADCFD